MRPSLALTLVGATLFAVGCQGASPAHPASTSSLTAPSPVSSSGPAAVGSPQASASTDVLTIPVEFSIQPSGKAAIQACVGEAVDFGGRARLVAHQTTLADGTTLLDLLHLNPQGAIAVGMSSGATYRLVGGESTEVISVPAGTFTVTFEANLRAIGPGSAGSFLAHILEHITVAADGSLTAYIDIFSVDCR